MTSSTSIKPTPVIIDCDPGRDDAWAIISLIKSEEKFNIKVIGITIVNGNTSVDHSSRNALLVLERLNRLDIPVFIGAESSLIKKSHYPKFHGDDGFFNYYTEKPDKKLIQKVHAVEALKDYINLYEGDLVLFAVGPLTNLALLYKLNAGISSKLKKVVIMGGNYAGVGNVRNVSICGEFNFWCDPEAAHIVLEETKCELMIFPWETCVDSTQHTPMEWRMKVLSNNSDITNLMDPIDERSDRFIPCDTYAIVCFLLPQMIIKSRSCNVTVELAGNHARGQMVLDHHGFHGLKSPKATIVEQIDIEMFKRYLMWLCGHENIVL